MYIGKYTSLLPELCKGYPYAGFGEGLEYKYLLYQPYRAFLQRLLVMINREEKCVIFLVDRSMSHISPSGSIFVPA